MSHPTNRHLPIRPAIIGSPVPCRRLLVILLLAMLSACTGPETPAENPPGAPSQPATTDRSPEQHTAAAQLRVCPKDAKLCPDGITSVGRDPKNNCEFFPCPRPSTMPSKMGDNIDGTATTRPPESKKQVFCPQDVRQCPDGSWVGRDPENNCRFRSCPDGSVPGETPDNPRD